MIIWKDSYTEEDNSDRITAIKITSPILIGWLIWGASLLYTMKGN